MDHSRDVPFRDPAPVGVLTVDDHAGFRAAAREIVAATPGFETVGEAQAGPEALEAVERLAPELVILDVRMPGMSGIEVARRVTAAHPDTVVLLVSSDALDDAAEAARVCGARAFLSKEHLRPATLRSLWKTHGGSEGHRAG